MADEPITPEAQATPATEQPKSLHERLESIVDQHTSEVAAADATVETPAAAGTPAQASADPTGSAAPAETPAPEPEKIVVTDEQLADTAYWGALDEDGWKRMARDYPTHTTLSRKWQGVVSKVANKNRQAAPPPANTRSETIDAEPSPELLDAVIMSQSLDPKEAARGHLLIAKLTAPNVLRENGYDPDVAKANESFREAASIAVEAMPALLPLIREHVEELDVIADEHPALKALAATGDPQNIAIALQEAGKIFVERKTAVASKAKSDADAAVAEAKKKELQKIVKSNARPASADVMASHGATPQPKVPLRQRLGGIIDTFTAQQN